MLCCFVLWHCLLLFGVVGETFIVPGTLFGVGRGVAGLGARLMIRLQFGLKKSYSERWTSINYFVQYWAICSCNAAPCCIWYSEEVHMWQALVGLVFDILPHQKVVKFLLHAYDYLFKTKSQDIKHRIWGPLNILPWASYSLWTALADEKTVAGTAHVFSAGGRVADRRSLVALTALDHVLNTDIVLINVIIKTDYLENLNYLLN